MPYEDPTFATSASNPPRMKVNIELNNPERTYFTVDEWYSKEELCSVWKELDFLTDFKKFTFKDDTLQINLDEKYTDESISNILKFRYKDRLPLFSDQVWRTFGDRKPLEDFLNCTKVNSTLRYFHHAMGWEEHTSDDKFVSYCVFWREPISFEGGDIILEGRKVKSFQSRLAFFPGYYKRKVTGINFTDPKRTLGNGLYVLTTSYN